MFLRIIKYACFTLAALCLAAFAISCSKKDEGVQIIQQEEVDNPDDPYNPDREPASDDDASEIPDEADEEIVPEVPAGEDGEVADGEVGDAAEDIRTEIVGIGDIIVKEGLSKEISLSLRNLLSYSGEYTWNYTVGEGAEGKISAAWENEVRRDKLIITGLCEGRWSLKITAVTPGGDEIAGKDIEVMVEENQPVNETAINGEMLTGGSGKFRLRAVKGSGNFTWEGPQLKEGASDGLELEKIEEGGILKIRIKALKIGDYKISTAFRDNVLGLRYEKVHALKVVEDISVNIYPANLADGAISYDQSVGSGISKGYGIAVVVEDSQGDSYNCEITRQECTGGFTLEPSDVAAVGSDGKHVACVLGVKQDNFPPDGVTCSNLRIDVSGAYVSGTKLVPIDEIKFMPGPCDAPLKFRVVREEEEMQYEGQENEVAGLTFMPKDADGYIIDSEDGVAVKRGVKYTAVVDVEGGEGPYIVDIKNNKLAQADCADPENTECYIALKPPNSDFNVDLAAKSADATNSPLVYISSESVDDKDESDVPKRFRFNFRFTMRRLNTEFKLSVTDSCPTPRTLEQAVKFNVSGCRLRNVKGHTIRIFTLYEEGWGDGDNDTNKSTIARYYLGLGQNPSTGHAGKIVAMSENVRLDADGNDIINDISQDRRVEITDYPYDLRDLRYIGYREKDWAFSPYKDERDEDTTCLEDIQSYSQSIHHDALVCWTVPLVGEVCGLGEEADIHTKKSMAVSCFADSNLDDIFLDNPPDTCLYSVWTGGAKEKDIFWNYSFSGALGTWTPVPPFNPLKDWPVK